MRDRDEAGRARNARPRDAYGRPLPRGTVGEEHVPDDYAAEPAEALADAQRLLDADRPFHAHEVLEAAWKAAPEPERDLWQGLAQLAVGLTHVRRGNALGATALLRRAAGRIAAYVPPGEEEPRDGPPSPDMPTAHDGPRDEPTAHDGPRDEPTAHDGPRGEPTAHDGPAAHAQRVRAPHGIAVGALVRHARELAGRIERDGLGAVTDADLAPRLRL